MNRKDPDKKGKSCGIYLNAQALAIYVEIPEGQKSEYVCNAIIEKANRCQHNWGMQKVTGTEMFEGVCLNCGVKLSSQIDLATKTL